MLVTLRFFWSLQCTRVSYVVEVVVVDQVGQLVQRCVLVRRSHISGRCSLLESLSQTADNVH